MKRILPILLGLLALRLVLMAVVPVFEPSEARYAAISVNMARTGDFLVPRFTHNLRYQSFDGKPPLVFQAGGLFCRLLGTGEGELGNRFANQFAVRLFPLLSAALLLWILYHCVRRKYDDEAARLAVAICATSTAFFAAAGISMTDMSLACCVAGALLLYDLGGWAARFGVAALLGAAMIVKGPVGLVMFGLPVLVDAAVNRNWGKFLDWRWLVVAPVFVAVAAPWFVLVERVNPGATWYFFYNENFLRFVTPDYGDKYGKGREAFRGVSILWALVATLPWSLLPLFRLVCRGLGKLGLWRYTDPNGQLPHRQLFTVHCPRLTSFFFLAFASIVGFWCLTSRVLVYYLFPVIPLSAAFLATTADRDWLKKCVPWTTGISAAVVGIGLVVGMFASEKMRGADTPFEPRGNHYACEFYHGTKPEAELAPLRDAENARLISRGKEPKF